MEQALFERPSAQQRAALSRGRHQSSRLSSEGACQELELHQVNNETALATVHQGDLLSTTAHQIQALKEIIVFADQVVKLCSACALSFPPFLFSVSTAASTRVHLVLLSQPGVLDRSGSRAHLFRSGAGFAVIIVVEEVGKIVRSRHQST